MAKPARARDAQDEALRRFEGERPTPELVAKFGADVVELSDLDPKTKGRAIRAGWRPRTLYNAKRITKRQYSAACELVTLFETGFLAPIRGAKWGGAAERVDGGGASRPAPDSMLDAARRYERAMSGLSAVQRIIVHAVCVEGQTMEALASADRIAEPWLPGSQQNRQIAIAALFAAGLDACADALRL